MDPWYNHALTGLSPEAVNRKSQDAGGKTTLQDIHVVSSGSGFAKLI
jgi:hypothetical protein